MPSLDELKKEVEAEEKGEVIEAVVEEVIEDAEVEEAPEIEAKQDDDKPADDEKKGDDAAEPESWMKSEDEEKDEKKSFGDPVAAAIRRKEKSKWQGRLSEAESKADLLAKELEELKKKVETAPAPVLTGKPKPEDFDNDSAYQEALLDYGFKIREDRQKSAMIALENKKRTEHQRETVRQANDLHYERMAYLAQKSNIKPETCQAADYNFRSAINEVFPGSGDAVADVLIANLGDGSEKLVYHFGVNRKKMEHLANLLKQDPNGITASVYLGEQKALLTMPSKRESRTPEPIDDIQGDKKGGVQSEAKMKKEFDELSSKNPQAAYNLKKKARDQKIDVSRW